MLQLLNIYHFLCEGAQHRVSWRMHRLSGSARLWHSVSGQQHRDPTETGRQRQRGQQSVQQRPCPDQ